MSSTYKSKSLEITAALATKIIAEQFPELSHLKIFKEIVNLDRDTWDRARGWALWKATYEICNQKHSINCDSSVHKLVIDEILGDYDNR